MRISDWSSDVCSSDLVLESDDVVGGISRTVVADGYRFDIGGHRFFTKVPEVEALWHEILPDEDFMLRHRSSRIYYGGKFYDYPIKVGHAQIGRPSCRESVCPYVKISVGPVPLKKKKKNKNK